MRPKVEIFKLYMPDLKMSHRDAIVNKNLISNIML